MRRFAVFGPFALVLAATLPVAAQEPARPPLPYEAPIRRELPPAVAEQVMAFFNDPAVLQFSGRTRVPAGTTLRGDVAVLGGPLVLAGRIEGRVVVVNGDVVLLAGGEVTGGITAVGGTVTGADAARVGGEVLAYAERLQYERRGERMVALLPDTARSPAGFPVRTDEEGGWAIGESAAEDEGRRDFVVATGQSYNRVEGMPITFGPVLETGGTNPTRLRASAIYRTEEGLALGPGRWGYDVRLEQFVGGERALRVGASVRSVVDPVEGWHVSKLENGLATFFLRRDYRDHYERKGWSAYVTAAPRQSPLSLTGEFRSEHHNTVPAGSPWTLFDNEERWRPQPLVAEGRLKSVSLRGAYDTRSEREDPATGWHVRAEVERTTDTELVRQAALPLGAPAGPVVPAEPFGDFTAGMLDVRRYNRLSPTSRLNFRLMAGGSLDGSRLPPQRQHALGGEGTLPGYGLFSLDCGARRTAVLRPRDVREQDGVLELPSVFFTGYGCDRFVLAQAEYRGKLQFRFRWSEPDDVDDQEAGDEDVGDDDDAPDAGLAGAIPGGLWNAEFSWVAFVDAGGGWSVSRDVFDDKAVDVGFGLLLGKVGVYGAIPLEGGRGVNLFVRLAPRF